jgi:hypothetical protein
MNRNFLQQYDPEDLRNVVLDLKRRVDALSQGFVNANSASELFNTIGNLQYRATDSDGNLRMVMSSVDLFEDLGVHATFAGLNASGVVTVYLNADDGKIVFGGGDGWLDEWGLTFANQEGAVFFRDTDDGDTMFMFSDGDNWLVLTNQYGARGISFLLDDAAHNVNQIDFDGDGNLDLWDGKYRMGGVNIKYLLPYSTHLNFATIGAGVTSWASPFLGATSSEAGQLVLRACTAKNFIVRTATAQPGTGSLVLTVRKNGVDTALVITIAAGGAAGNYSNTVNSVSFAAGDRIAFRLVNNASSASAQIAPLAVEMETEI